MENAICLNSNTYHGFPLEDAVAGAAAAGIRHIELSAVRGWTEHVLPEMPESRIREIGALLGDAGLTPIALGGHSNLIEPEGRSAFRANLLLAARLGVGYVVTGTGETHGDETEVADEPAFAAELRELAEEAELAGLRIAIETHGANYATGAQVARLVDLVAHPALGIAYDTGNVIFYGGVEPYDDLERVADRVVGFHLKDKAGAPDAWDFPALGDGTLDLARIDGILRRTECSAPMSIEIEFTPEGPGDVETVHRAVLRSVEALAALP